nr:putative F-box/LRR-repeat protein At3g28410 [Quercus suber]
MERHVMDEKICAVDRISDLPEFILHHIFSLLYRKEAAKTGLLSKKWNCVWSSFPIFDFDQMHYFNLHSPCVPDTRPESQNRVEKFMNDVDKSISRFHVHQLPMQKFILNMTLFDFKLASLVDKWIGMALEHDVKEIDLQVQTKRNTWYCLPGTIFVAKSTNNCKLEQPFSWCALNYYSLQKLWLSHICVNEEIIQDIFRSCPFITDFGLIGCYGLKTLDISKLPKLCSVEVYSLEQTVEILRVEAANLEYFRFSYSDLRISPPFIETIDHGSLIDGLLWSCCPKKLSLRTGLESRENCIKVLCEKVLDREDLDHCCTCRPKCWRHHLKGAKIISIPGIEDDRLLNCKTLFDILPTLDRNHAIQFRLDWDHHLHGEVA